MDKIRAPLAGGRRSVEGITLLELVVASLILAMLSGMIFLTLQTSRAAQKKLDAVDTNQRAHLMAKLNLAEWLRGARLATPNHDQPNSATLVFQKPLITGGFLQVDVLGNTLWTEFFEVSADTQGHLLLTSAAGPQILARLGTGSTFAAKALENKVRVTLKSPAVDGHEARMSSMDFYVAGEVLPGEIPDP